MTMSPEDLALYKIDYTEDGRSREGNITGLAGKIREIREVYGFPFFSCRIALCNTNGDVEEAIKLLVNAFKRSVKEF